MTWTKNPWFGVFLMVGVMGVSLLLATAAPAAEADDGSTTETAAAAGDGSAPETETEEGKEEETKTEEQLLTESSVADQAAFAIDNITLFFCAVLVLFMQAGFAMLEAGMNAAKNTINILFKNIMDLSVGVLLFFVLGYGLMYPGFEDGQAEGATPQYEVIGFAQSGIPSLSAPAGPGVLFPQVDFLFQVAFAATAATIVSGAVAGRMKFGAYLVYSAFLTGLIYPISGGWKWGFGWLHDMGFHDFAGSVVVHAVGGFAGLAGAIVLGARLGRFTKDGKSVPIPGHNIAFAALGVFILWVGWYGFNPGSNLVFSDGASAAATMLIAVNTTLSAAAGALIAMVCAWCLFKKPDLTMALNGALAGLVGITANCDCVNNFEAIAIGAVAGVLVVAGILLLDKLRIDDPVGAWPVHGLCGIWGCVAAGIFGAKPLGVQILGSVVIAAWAFGTMFVLFLVLKAIGMLRVSPEEEQSGLDVSEHGMHAYPPSLVADYHPSKPASEPAPATVGKA